MTYQPGKNIFLLDGTGTGATAIACLQMTQFKIGSKTIDVTNRDSNGWQELLSGGGITSAQITANGIISDGTIFAALGSRALARTLNPYTVDFGADLVYSGQFIVSDWEGSGNFDKEQTYKMTLDSSGTVTAAGT